jgi:hypothetical protein
MSYSVVTVRILESPEISRAATAIPFGECVFLLTPVFAPPPIALRRKANLAGTGRASGLIAYQWNAQ